MCMATVDLIGFTQVVAYRVTDRQQFRLRYEAANLNSQYDRLVEVKRRECIPRPKSTPFSFESHGGVLRTAPMSPNEDLC